MNTQKLIVGVAIVAIAGGAIAFYVMKPKKPSLCERMLGPVDRIEAITGPLRADKPLAYGDECEQYFWRKDGSGNPVLILDIKSSANYDYMKSDLASKKYDAHESIPIPGGAAELYIAGDRPQPSTDALQADAMRRVGHSADPMGDALASLPPAHHAVVIRYDLYATKLEFDMKAFTPAQVKDLVGKITAGWH
jgi:hypothetical protein